MNNTDIHKTKDSHSRLGMLLMVFVVTIGVVFLAMMLWHSFIPIAEHQSVDVVGIAFSFVGILATFIVIGNYAQVSDIRGEVRREIADVYKEQKNLESNISLQLNRFQTKQAEHTKLIQDLESLREDFGTEQLKYEQDTNSRNTKFILETFGNLLQLSQQDLILFQKLYLNADGEEVEITLQDGSEITVKIRIIGGKLEITNDKQSIAIEDVTHIKGKKRNLSKIASLIEKMHGNNTTLPIAEAVDGYQSVEDTPMEVDKNAHEKNEEELK